MRIVREQGWDTAVLHQGPPPCYTTFSPLHTCACTHTHTHTHTHTLQTFRHGFPSQPTCLAYDPVQQLLAIGTENGTVLLYPTAAIGQMRRIIDNY